MSLKTTVLAVRFLRQTEWAVLVRDCTGEHWLPKSQITEPAPDDWDGASPGEDIDIEVAAWLAEKKRMSDRPTLKPTPLPR